MMSVLLCVLVLGCLATVLSVRSGRGSVAVQDLGESDEFDHQLCKRLSGLSGLPTQHARWPSAALTSRERGGLTLVGLVDGLLVGRGILEDAYHPYCELVNLYVRHDYEGRGVATAIVAEAVARARRLGFKYMVLQEFREAAEAHGIYQKAGFLPAQVGEMQRLICLLDVPVVGLFLRAHPDAEFSSRPDTSGLWRLTWCAGGESVALALRGGSCQFDSDGFQTVIGGCELVTAKTSFAARVEAPPTVPRGATFDLTVAVSNHGSQALTAVVRAALPPETEVVGDFALAAVRLELGAGGEETVRLPIRVRHEFPCDGQRFRSYPSTPFTAEVCYEAGSVLLSSAVKVS